MNQSSSLDFKLVQRVCLLQQALDQALDSLEEMRAQVQDKRWVEAQLANTEKYANVQQQAIAHLKQHLSQFTEIQRNLLGVMAYRLNELIHQQQGDFKRLSLQIHQGETELQTYLQYLRNHCRTEGSSAAPTDTQCLELESEIMIARSVVSSLSRHLQLTRQFLSQLESTLDNHHLNLSHIIKTIQAMVDDLNGVEASPPQALPALASAAEAEALDPDSSPPHPLQETVRWQEQRIQELETALMEQFAQRTQLKHRYQVLAAERDFYRRQWEQSQGNSSQLPPEQLPASSSPPPADEPPSSPQWNSPPRLRSQPPPPIQPLRLQEDH